MNEFWFVLTCVGAAATGALGLALWLSDRRARATAREHLADASKLGDTTPAPLLAALRWGERLDASAWGNRLAGALAQADLDVTPSRFAGVLLGVWFGLLLATWWFFQPPLVIGMMLSGALAGLGARFFLDTRRDHYLGLLAQQMPDTAILVGNSMRAGLSVVQAFDEVARKMPRPAGVEFGRLVRQVHLGTPFDETIQQMMRRLPCEELTLLLTTIAIQRRAGGNLARALGVMAEAISARHRIRNEISTLTAEARYTSLVVIILPVVMLAMLNQMMAGSVTTFLSDPLGGFVITPIFVAVQAVAYMMISRIANIRV